MHPRRPNPAPQSRGRVWVAVCGNPAAAVEQPAPKLPNLVFQALQRVFESDSFVDYVCSPELEERSGDMKRSEFHPAARNCMKIPRRRDQTKVGAVKKSFPNFRLVIWPQGFRILRINQTIR